MGEMVEVPARMPAHGRASTPSRGGREGAVVLRQIEGLPHFCTIPIVEKEIVLLNHQLRRVRDDFIAFSSGQTTRC